MTTESALSRASSPAPSTSATGRASPNDAAIYEIRAFRTSPHELRVRPSQRRTLGGPDLVDCRVALLLAMTLLLTGTENGRRDASTLVGSADPRAVSTPRATPRCSVAANASVSPTQPREHVIASPQHPLRGPPPAANRLCSVRTQERCVEIFAICRGPWAFFSYPPPVSLRGVVHGVKRRSREPRLRLEAPHSRDGTHRTTRQSTRSERSRFWPTTGEHAQGHRLVCEGARVWDR